MTEQGVPLVEFVRPLDVLLFRPDSLAGWMIAVKTWNRQTSHSEVVAYKTETILETFTARGAISKEPGQGSGVNMYRDLASRVERISFVLRPKQAGRPTTAYLWAMSHAVGQSYDYLGLAVFALAARQGSVSKMHCSEAVCRYLRHADIEPFHPNADADLVAPATYLFSTAFIQYPVVNGRVLVFSGV